MPRKNKPTQQAHDDNWLQKKHSYAHNRATLTWLKEEVERCQRRLEKILQKIRKVQNAGKSSSAYREDGLNFFPLRKAVTTPASKPIRSMSHHPRVQSH